MENTISYNYLCSMGNLILAWREARKGKTSKADVLDFDKNVEKNLLDLHNELKNKTYQPRDLVTFVLRDPKTRVISKADFRDRIVHHTLIRVIGSIFEKGFIYDSCANQKGKGNLFALKRFNKYSRKVTHNFTQAGFCLKADIKHYFQEVDKTILLKIIKRKIKNEDILWIIKQILNCTTFSIKRTTSKEGALGENSVYLLGMPLGNLTSQFFANVYLNDLDYFVKHILKIKFYIRYVDDFVILHNSKKQLENWKAEIDNFLRDNLKIELHPQKSKIVSLCNGIDFIGFRIFPKYKLLRSRNIRNMMRKIGLYEESLINFHSIADSYQGWQAYARWANSHKLRKQVRMRLIKILWDRID